MVSAGALVSQSALAWLAGRVGGGDPAGGEDQAGRLGPRGGRARRLLDDGEPLLRPLLRRLSEGPRVRRSPEALARARSPELPGRRRDLFPKHKLLPFHLDSTAGFECTDDLTHDWGPMHKAGTGERWIMGQDPHPGQWEGPNGAMTMGYYKRQDLPFHWALADHFTLVRRLSLLDPRSDPPQSADGQLRHDRSGRQSRRSGREDELQLRHALELHVADDAGGARGRGRLVEGLQPSNAGVSGKYAALKEVPDLDPRFYDPSHQPERDGHLRPRAAVLHGVPRPEHRRCSPRRSSRRSRTISSPTSSPASCRRCRG